MTERVRSFGMVIKFFFCFDRTATPKADGSGRKVEDGINEMLRQVVEAAKKGFVRVGQIPC